MAGKKEMTLFLGIYYNNPHFIDIQYKMLKHYVKDEFDFIVVDDSSFDTKSIYLENLAGTDIREECERLKLMRIKTPDFIHKNVSFGGLVPEGLPADHPTERHRATLHWLIKNNKKLPLSLYKTVVIMDSDILVNKPMNVSEYMEDYDFVGPGRQGTFTKTPTNYWPDTLKETEITINWFPMYMIFINMNTVTNLEEMNVGGFAGSDTGGQNGIFLKDNPQYKCCFLKIGSEYKYQSDFFSKTSNEMKDAEFLHFRGGTNWDLQGVEYYKEKLNRLLTDFMPGLLDEYKRTPITGLVSKDGEHKFEQQ